MFSSCGLEPQKMESYKNTHHKKGYFLNDSGLLRVDPDFKMGVIANIKFLFNHDSQVELQCRDPTNDFSQEHGIRHWWLSHATSLIQIMDKWIITDPVFDACASPVDGFIIRKTPTPLHISKLPKIDFILVSHCHWDHLSERSIKYITSKNPECHVFCPLNVSRYIKNWNVKNITEFDWRTKLTVHDIEFYAFPAEHGSSRWGYDANQTLWCSFAIKYHNVIIYYSGDTAVGNQFKEVKDTLGHVDYLLAGIGPQDPSFMMRQIHLDGKEALEMMRQCGAKKFTPVHYQTFPLGYKSKKSDLEFMREGIRDGEEDRVIELSVGGMAEWNGNEFVKVY